VTGKGRRRGGARHSGGRRRRGRGGLAIAGGARLGGALARAAASLPPWMHTARIVHDLDAERPISPQFSK
jgi:hypothetical protein